jgi:NAD-dependent SIR2 family protein deacetylase
LPPLTPTPRFELIASASRLLILGTSLATYSAFRLIKAAREAAKPVLMISNGPTRADDTEGVDKMEVPAAPVLRAFLNEYLR